MTKEKPFGLIALDANFDIITLVPYSNLQWCRKYHEAGTFSVVLSSKVQYTKEWKYIYTSERPELGLISQLNWSKKGTSTEITISGYFMENVLNKMIVYPKPSVLMPTSGTESDLGVSILNDGFSPAWVSYEGTADEVARAFFNGFKNIHFKNYKTTDFDGNTLVTESYGLGIDLINVESGNYKYSCHTRNGEKLGAKLYDILNESRASYRVNFDFETKQMCLTIIHGKDRSSTTTEDVNPCVLSSMNGTITDASLVVSDTEKKDAIVQYSESDDLTMVLVNAQPNSIGRFLSQSMSQNRKDYLSDNDEVTSAGIKKFKLDAMASGNDKLRTKGEKFNFQFSAITGSYEYMVDFDLGDVVSIEIPEIDLSMDAQIIGLNEVIKKGVWSMSFEVGNTILRKRGNY